MSAAVCFSRVGRQGSLTAARACIHCALALVHERCAGAHSALSRRHGLIMGCSVTGRKPLEGPSLPKLTLGPKVEERAALPDPFGLNKVRRDGIRHPPHGSARKQLLRSDDRTDRNDEARGSGRLGLCAIWLMVHLHEQIATEGVPSAKGVRERMHAWSP